MHSALTSLHAKKKLNTMNYQTIKKLQKYNGYSDIQSMIDSGIVWRMEGTMGRYAMDLLESGACMLPKKSHRDYYGNRIPSRDELQKGSKGTFENSVNFYSNY